MADLDLTPAANRVIAAAMDIAQASGLDVALPPEDELVADWAAAVLLVANLAKVLGEERGQTAQEVLATLAAEVDDA